MNTERLCPSCGDEPLAPFKARGLELDQCPRCAGLWFDWGELFAFEPEKKMTLQRLLEDAAKEGKPSGRPCPSCRGPMSEEQAGPVRVDQCLACAGLWLDEHELEALLDSLD